MRGQILCLEYVLYLLSAQSLEQNWPSEFKKVQAEMAKQSGEKTSTGKSTAPSVRGKKRKIEDESHEREPILTSVSPLDPTSTQTGLDTAAQPALKASWGEVTKLTAARQAQIDYFLLRFIICCAIAFSITDNGFFRDFIHAL